MGTELRSAETPESLDAGIAGSRERVGVQGSQKESAGDEQTPKSG